MTEPKSINFVFVVNQDRVEKSHLLRTDYHDEFVSFLLVQTTPKFVDHQRLYSKLVLDQIV